MALYGTFTYGTSFYGASAALPTSAMWEVFDFCEPTDATMLTLFSYPEVSSLRGSGPPHQYYNVDNDLCMMSDDEDDSGFRVDISITPSFTFQFTVLPTALPDDFSDLASKRFFVAAYNQYQKMIGVLLSENGGIALARTGTDSGYEALADSADLFYNGSTYYTFRVVVDIVNNRGHLYVTERDLVPYIGHQLRYSFPLQDTPAGLTDHVLLEVVGDSGDPTEICLDCIRLHNEAVMANRRPIAVPGPDKTRPVGQYALFDGSGSYDPDGDVIQQYWWTISFAPLGSDLRSEGLGTTDADASGSTMRVTAAAGTFDGISESDLFAIGDYKSPVIYVSGDGSELIVKDRVLPAAATDADWVCIKQSTWNGNTIPSKLIVVLSAQTDPSLLTPSTGDSYLVLPSAVGAWSAKDNQVATWSGSTWTYYGPEDGDILLNLSAVMTYRYLYLPPAPPPYGGVWYEDEPAPWELEHWDGRAQATGSMLSDHTGLHIVELMVNDGELDSLPVEVVLNVFLTDVQLGLIPDLTFLWGYLPDFWDLVPDRDKIDTIWSSFTQIIASDMLALWQHDYSKSLRDIQRVFQRQWLAYDLLYEEPNYSELPATILNDVNVSGFSTAPNVSVTDPSNPPATIDSETAYDLDTTVTAIDDSHALILAGIAYPIARVQQDATTIVVTKDAMPTGTDRSGAWSIRPTVTSQSSDFTYENVTAGDQAVFKVTKNDEDTSVVGYVWGVREGLLAFDDVNLAAHLLDSESTVRFFGVLRRSAMTVDDLVVSLPRLQEVINLRKITDAPDPLNEDRDYLLDDYTTILGQEVRRLLFVNAWFSQESYGFHGDLSTVGSTSVFTTTETDFVAGYGAGADMSGYVLDVDGNRYRLGQVLSATELELYNQEWTGSASDKSWTLRKIEDPPDLMWAEITYLDNRPTIEANFGRLVGFTLDQLEERTDNLDYLSAVQGLWYTFWFGPTPNNIRNGAQILLGLPFAEASGIVFDIKSPYDGTRDRIIVRDTDDPSVYRTYYYPTSVGLAVSRTTGVDLAVGDSVEQFDPLSKGVEISDWVSDPDWINTLVGSGDAVEAQKVHSFIVRVQDDVADLTNLLFMLTFVRRIKPKYTFPILVVAKELADSVDVGDSYVSGPVIPTSGSYPDTWTAFTNALGWSPPAPNEENAAGAISRTTPPTYDITTRWPNDRFVTPRGENPINPFGNLQLYDAPGRVPDGWEGAWDGLPATHEATRAQGARKYDANDHSGHLIHKFDPHLYAEDLFKVRDGHMEEAALTYWTQIGTPTTFAKSAAQKYTGTRSLEIDSSIVGEGGSNVFGASDSDSTPTIHTVPADPPSTDGGAPGFQVAVTGWLRLVSGMAVLRLIDQDGSTVLAEVRRSQLIGQWQQFVLHHWHYHGAAAPLMFQAISGPAGGHFFIDAAEAFIKAVPWSQIGYDRSIMGRTGGYTFGGDPDEFFQARMHFLAP